MSAWLLSFGIVHLGLFVSAVMLLNLTPGPDTAYIVGRSLAQGPRAGVLSALGISLGCCVHCLLCAFGLTALLAASASAFMVIKYVGAIYLLILGIRMCWPRDAPLKGESTLAPKAAAASITMSSCAERHALPSSLAPRHQRAAHLLLLQGFLTNVSNPKVILFFVAFFPQFVLRDSPSKVVALLMLGAMFLIMSTIYNTLMAWLSGRITARLRRIGGLSLWLERGVGLAFIALGARLAFIDRPG